jgi:hypothetical protein
MVAVKDLVHIGEYDMDFILPERDHHETHKVNLFKLVTPWRQA